MVLDAEGKAPTPTLEDRWRFRIDEVDSPVNTEVLEIWISPEGGVETRWVPVRPIPEEDGWFEKTWREYREGQIIR
jgi:hypothetical protein